MVLGRLRLQRLSNVELLRIRNSPSCLHSIEPSCGIGQARSLSVHMANASIEDLLYLSRASDIVSLYVEQVIAKRTQDAKKERLWKRRVRYCTADTIQCDIIYSFLLIILILSVFEKSEESVRNVILYGVPGLPGVSISENETYSTIRKEILQLAPNLPSFYFVHRGVIIKKEDVEVKWGGGHVVLNVHFRGVLKGGTKKKKRNIMGLRRCIMDDDYTPESEKRKKKKKWKSRRKSARSRENAQRTSEHRRRENDQHTAEQRRRENAQRTAEQRW